MPMRVVPITEATFLDGLGSQQNRVYLNRPYGPGAPDRGRRAGQSRSAAAGAALRSGSGNGSGVPRPTPAPRAIRGRGPVIRAAKTTSHDRDVAAEADDDALGIVDDGADDFDFDGPGEGVGSGSAADPFAIDRSAIDRSAIDRSAIDGTAAGDADALEAATNGFYNNHHHMSEGRARQQQQQQQQQRTTIPRHRRGQTPEDDPPSPLGARESLVLTTLEGMREAQRTIKASGRPRQAPGGPRSTSRSAVPRGSTRPASGAGPRGLARGVGIPSAQGILSRPIAATLMMMLSPSRSNQF
jgi:hypothetical protein